MPSLSLNWRSALAALGLLWCSVAAATGGFATRAALDGELCAQGTGVVDLDILVCRRALRGGGFQGASRATLHNALGRAFRRQGRPERAAAEHDAALLLNPVSAVAFHDRGLARLDLVEPGLAAADMDRAIGLFPAYGDAHRARGRIAFLSGHPGEAIRHLDTAIALQPGNGEAFAFRGFARFQERAFVAAAADFRQAQVLDLDFPYTALWLALSLERSGVEQGMIRAVLQRAADRFEDGEWPGPLLQVLLAGTHGSILLDDEAPATGHSARRRYETRFYRAMAGTGQGGPERARALLDTVRREAPPLSLEGVMARHALQEGVSR